MKCLCDPVAVTKEQHLTVRFFMPLKAVVLRAVTSLAIAGKAQWSCDIEAGILASDTLYYATRNW